MDWISLKEKAVPFLNQYKYVLAVVLIGLILMAIPGKEEAAPETMAQPSLSEPGIFIFPCSNSLFTIFRKYDII